MNKPLPGPYARGRIHLEFVLRVALSLGLLCCIYLVSIRAIALWHFNYQFPPNGIEKAVAWDPQNPEYHFALGRFYEQSVVEPHLDLATRHYERAIELSSNRARYWADLAGAYESAGRVEQAEAACKRARELFPNSPRINWQLGNFWVRRGRINEALPSFRKAILGDPELRPLAFDLAWRVEAKPDAILERMMPADTAIFVEYLNYLAQTQRLDAARHVWGRLLELGLPSEPRAVFPYLDVLIQARRVDELTAAWAVLEERHPTLSRRRHQGSNLITDGDFESDILNGGLSWRVLPFEGVGVSVDTLTFFDGIRSLRITFDGKLNADYRHVLHYVLVKPNTLYRFTGYMRVQGLTTDSGVRFELQDAYDRNRLYLVTENLVGTSSWSLQQRQFRTGSDTQLLLLHVVRPPSRKFDNRIAGTAWVDRVSLHLVK